MCAFNFLSVEKRTKERINPEIFSLVKRHEQRIQIGRFDTVRTTQFMLIAILLGVFIRRRHHQLKFTVLEREAFENRDMKISLRTKILRISLISFLFFFSLLLFFLFLLTLVLPSLFFYLHFLDFFLLLFLFFSSTSLVFFFSP